MPDRSNNPEPKIVYSEARICVGMRLESSLTLDRTRVLWQRFGPRIKEIKYKVGPEKISLNVYPASYFQSFQPSTTFMKWALVEVSSAEIIPEHCERFIIPQGEYAVFRYQGLNTDKSIFQYIFETWVPQSGFQLDNRPHFEVLGNNYANNDPASEEDIWIPIRPISPA